jgi:hypothetical protein
MTVRKFVLAAVLSLAAVQPVNAGPREEQLALSTFLNVMGVIIIQSARASDPAYIQYRGYGPSMSYYPEPQQNSYENWLRRNTVPYRNGRPPFPDEDDDMAFAPSQVPPAPPPVIYQRSTPTRQTAFGPIAMEWSSCLDQSLKEETANNPDAVLARCNQYTPLGIAALVRDGFTRTQANERIAGLVAKARRFALESLTRAYHGLRPAALSVITRLCSASHSAWLENSYCESGPKPKTVRTALISVSRVKVAFLIPFSG